MPLVLACGGPEILLFLLVIPLGGFGLLYLTYLPYRAALNALATEGMSRKPVTLFVAAFGGGLLWLALTYVAGMGILLLAQRANAEPLLVMSTLVLVIVGIVGWFSLLVGRKSYKRANPCDPLPPMQVWMQDLVIALLCYGMGLTIISSFFGFDRRHMEEFVPWAIYLVFSGSIGLSVALDVCRRDPKITAAKRAALFVGIFTVFPLTLPLAIAAYFRWRGAIRRAH